MRHQLINLSPDLKRLRDEGYAIEICGGYVCIHHIPYVNSEKQVKYDGKLITDLTLITPELPGNPQHHTVYFVGDLPCHGTGEAMTEIINSSPHTPLTDKITGDHYLSSKPKGGNYANYYDKFLRYITLITVAARSLDPDATARTYIPMDDDDEDGVFEYYDTNSSRANILQLNARFKNQKVGIIGLGGTGSYLLDFLAKMCLAEIHLFDGDDFKVHNAFRTPGAASKDGLLAMMKKVDYFAGIYSKMHKGIKPHSVYITEETKHLLAGLSFVFICVDKNSVRHAIMKILLAMNIPFIDVGMGVRVIGNKLTGMTRTTVGTPGKHDHVENRIPTEDTDDNDYTTNVQIAELNAYNAVSAIIKWKKMAGFYQDLREEYHSTYSINVGEIINEDTQA
jgi:molybdopterin/thiamine biosynthesis adenylyltransferase